MRELHTAYNGEIVVFEPEAPEGEGFDIHVGGIHIIAKPKHSVIQAYTDIIGILSNLEEKKL